MNVLVIAPHPDDEVIGCGGMIAKHVAEGSSVTVCIVSEGTPPLYDYDFLWHEAMEMQEAHDTLGISRTIRLGLPTARLDTLPMHEINDKLSSVVDKVHPDIVYIPHHGDVHKDHQIVAQASMVAVRPNKEHKVKKVLSYEVLSETGWNVHKEHNMFFPNIYADISEFIFRKIVAFEKYGSQAKESPNARSSEAIRALAMYRGSVVGIKYAEAFELMREVDT